MKKMSRLFNCICTQKYQSLGFVRSKSTFIRINGDVIQAFTFKYSRGVPICSVEFGIFPLCLPQPIFLEAGGYDLDEFIVELHEKRSGWTFDSNSEKSMMDCIESITQAIDLYLLPFFNACSDCESALPELVKLEALFDRNRQRVLHLRGDVDAAVPWQERSLYDYKKYFMALKARDLSYAKQYLNHQVNFCYKSLKLLDDPNAPGQPEIVRDRFLAKLTSCLEQLERLDAEDFGYFDDILNANADQMKKILAAQYPKIRSNL